MTLPTVYIIQANWQVRDGSYQGFVKVNESNDEIQFVSMRTEATQFQSKVLASGWMVQAQAFFPTYNFMVIIA